MTPGEQRWSDVVQHAAVLGITEADLRRQVEAPTRRGGCGWSWFQPEQTTKALARWLRLWCQRQAAARAAARAATPPPPSGSGAAGAR